MCSDLAYAALFYFSLTYCGSINAVKFKLMTPYTLSLQFFFPTDFNSFRGYKISYGINATVSEANKMNLVGRPSVNGLSYIQKGSENRTGFKILNRKSQLCSRMYACRPWTSHNMLRNSSIQDGRRISASKILPRCYANASCLHCYYHSSLWLLFASPSVSLSSSSCIQQQ